MPEQQQERILERELAKITDAGHRKIAKAAAEDLWKFSELLPETVRNNIKPFVMSAVRYVRRHLNGEKFTETSFVDAVYDAAQYGLPIDGRLAYALPFADKDRGGSKNLVFVPDYKGIIAVAKQKGIVRDVRSYVVHEKDDFEAPGEHSDKGLTWRFRPANGDRGAVLGTLAVLEMADGRRHPEWMTEAEIQKVRSAAKTQKVWNEWPDEMRKKTAIRRAFKVHQDDPQLSSLLAADDDLYDDGVIDVGPKTRDLNLPRKQAARRHEPAERARPRKPEPHPELFEEFPESAGPKTETAPREEPKPAKRGRPKGSRNRPKAQKAEEPAEDRQEETQEPTPDAEDTITAARRALKSRFQAAWQALEDAGLDVVWEFGHYGVDDEAGDTMELAELSEIVGLMEEQVKAAAKK